MTRYQPTTEEQTAIDRLTLAGYTVVRARTYTGLTTRLEVAENQLMFEKEASEHTRRWAGKAFDEQRRLADRLDRVIAAAATQGVTLEAINAALDAIPSLRHVSGPIEESGTDDELDLN